MDNCNDKSNYTENETVENAENSEKTIVEPFPKK